MNRWHLSLVASVIGISWLIGAAVAAEKSEYRPPKPCTPDKQYCLEIVEQNLPDAPEDEDFTLVLRHKGEVLAGYPTMGYVLNLYRSPHVRYDALNNRRASSGDWIWVISLADGKVIKMPSDLAESLHKETLGSPNDGDAGLEEITKNYPQCAGDGIYHEYLLTKGWRSDDELKVSYELTCFHVDRIFEVENVYRIADGKMVRQSQRIETRKDTARY